MSIFIEVILPALIVFFIGYVTQRWKRMDLKSLSTLAVHILTPTLVFSTFYKAELNQQYLFITIFALSLLILLILLNKVYAKIRKYPQDVESALILSTAFMNAGNYGAPIVLFAFGEVGFAYAVSFMVLQSMIMNFFGVYYAARGHQGMASAVKSVFKMPLTYALLSGIFLNLTGIPVPENVFSSIDLLAAAAIPVAMLILGMQLAELEVGSFLKDRKMIFGVSTRMVASPLIAFGLTFLFPMDPLLKKVLVVQTAMPTAVTTTMYALQFGTLPKLVSSIVLVTTLVSVVTISVLLTFL